MILYKETKPHNEFAVPMAINGSNKVNDLFDNCMNKKTFEYKRYSSITPHNKKWIDNPLFIEDISQETDKLKTQYMDSREKAASDIYSSVFEDMYYLGGIPVNIDNSPYIQNILNELNNF